LTVTAGIGCAIDGGTASLTALVVMAPALIAPLVVPRVTSGLGGTVLGDVRTGVDGAAVQAGAANRSTLALAPIEPSAVALILPTVRLPALS